MEGFTEQEKKKIEKLLSQMSSDKRASVTANQTSFGQWLQKTLPKIWERTKDNLQEVLEWVKEKLRIILGGPLDWPGGPIPKPEDLPGIPNPWPGIPKSPWDIIKW